MEKAPAAVEGNHAPRCPLHELPQEYTDLYGLLLEGGHHFLGEEF
jgi:hypothetical protein